MTAEPNPTEPGYEKALADRIRQDAADQACGWTHPLVDRRGTSRLVIGLSIIAVGLALALDSLGLMDAGVVLRYWPVILIAIGIAKFTADSERQRGLIWIAAGVGFLLVTLGRMSFGGVWAMLLLFVGANVVWRALRPPLPRANPRGETLESFDLVAVLGGAKTGGGSRGVGPDGTIRPFRGGRAMAVMGGCQIDLRQASLAEGQEATVDVFVMWGGIEIRVPEEWQVVNHGAAFLGGIDNKARPLPGPTRRLIVTGTAIMGGVEVKN